MIDQGHQDEALTRALRAVADDDETLGASAEVEARLLAEARVIAKVRRRRVYAAAGALAATLLAAIAVPAWRAATVRRPAVDPPGPAASFARPEPGEVATEFFPLMYSNVPVTNGQTVRLELPQAALASFGVEYGDASFGLESGGASGTVLADVIVGQDGLARAVRFVRPATIVREQR
jgi:hypothetical protein